MKFLQLLGFLFLLILVSCKGQQGQLEVRNTPIKNTETAEIKTEVLQENPQQINQDFDHYFRENNKTKGAPMAITRNVLQDKTGKIWFASFEGIYMYDGTYFYNRTNLDSLRRYRAFSLMEASDGKIWIGTIGAGVYIYDHEIAKTGKSPWLNLNTHHGLVNDDVGCLFQDSKGNIWIGTGAGISCYDGKVFKNYTKADGMIDDDVNGIIEDKDGKIWIATRGQACLFDGQDFSKIMTQNKKSFSNVRSIILDSKGYIWLGGNDGLWCYDGKEFKDFKTRFIGNIYEDSNGTLWISQSDPEQIYQMTLCNYSMFDLLQDEPQSNLIVKGHGQVFGITEDVEGNIWFGLETGICKYDGISFNYFKE